MGEYTYKGTACVKIATVDEAFWSREELLAARKDGWGPERDDRPDELAQLLADPRTLYALPPVPSRTFADAQFTYPTWKVHFVMPFTAPWIADLEHRDVCVSVGEYEPRRNAWLPCPMTPEGKKFTLGVNAAQEFFFVAVGERYDGEGRGRTIFACAGCGAPFSLEKPELDAVVRECPRQAAAVRLLPRPTTPAAAPV